MLFPFISPPDSSCRYQLQDNDNGGMLFNAEPASAIYKAEEVYNIDMKMDDGKPATGKIWAQMGCTNAANSADKAATYTLTNTSLTYTISFIQAF